METATATEETEPKKKRRPRNKQGLLKLAEKRLLEKGDEIVLAFAEQLLAGVQKREKASMEMVARMMHGDKGPGGINLTNQTLIANQQAAEQSAGARSFESIVRRLESKDVERKALAEPTPIRRVEAPNLPILDAE